MNEKVSQLDGSFSKKQVRPYPVHSIELRRNGSCSDEEDVHSWDQQDKLLNNLSLTASQLVALNLARLERVNIFLPNLSNLSLLQPKLHI